MEKNNKFPEQQAPEKNTDNAFVKVGEDGAPVIPHTDEVKTGIKNEDELATPIKQ